MKALQTYGGWALLLLAIGAWVGIWFAASVIHSRALEAATTAQNTDQQAQRFAYQQRISALAADTQPQRAQLESLANHDIVSIVTTLENAGKALGVTVKVNNAQAVGSGEELPDGSVLRPIEFVLEARGSFTALMRALEVYEHLPLISSLTQVELGRTDTGSASSDWNLLMRVRVYTIADISI